MRSVLGAIYKEAFQRALGGSSANPYADLNLTYDDFMKRGYAAPGDRFPSDHGNLVIRWARIRGAGVVAGSPLKRFVGDATRIGTASAGSKTSITTADTLLNADIAGAILSIYEGTGLGQHRPILESDEAANASVISTVAPDFANYTALDKQPEIWAPAPDATSKYSVYANYEYTRQTAVTDPVSAVALATVAAGNFTLVVEEGPVPTECAGDTDAIIVNGLVVPSAAAGTAKGLDYTPADATVAQREAALFFGIGLHAWAAASGLALVDLLGRFKQ